MSSIVQQVVTEYCEFLTHIQIAFRLTTPVLATTTHNCHSPDMDSYIMLSYPHYMDQFFTYFYYETYIYNFKD